MADADQAEKNNAEVLNSLSFAALHTYIQLSTALDKVQQMASNSREKTVNSARD